MADNQRLILWIFSGVLGLNIGSFLNVCIFRLPRNCMSIVKPRSRCPKCLNWIAWYDNLPVLSWCLLGGKCRHCKNPISVRYTLVELLTGVVFFYAGWRALYLPDPPTWIDAVWFAVEVSLVSALIVCTFIDLEFEILPDEITLWGTLLGLLVSGLVPQIHGWTSMVYRLLPGHGLPWFDIHNSHLASLAASAFGAIAGGGSIWLVGFLGEKVFRKPAMGFGDVKFMAMIGSVLGWRGVLMTFVLACLVGSVFGLGKYAVKREMGYVPFGPFLALGAVAMLFWPGLVDTAMHAYLHGTEALLNKMFPH